MDLTTLLPIGPSALLTLVVLLILKGDLIVKRQFEREYKELQEERNTWRAAAQRADRMNLQLIISGRLATHAVTEIARRAEALDDDTGDTP